jgi:hypothetical protein
VIGDDPQLEFQDVGAVLTLARPTIAGDRAEVTTDLWCGDPCATPGTIHNKARVSPTSFWCRTRLDSSRVIFNVTAAELPDPRSSQSARRPTGPALGSTPVRR